LWNDGWRVAGHLQKEGGREGSFDDKTFKKGARTAEGRKVTKETFQGGLVQMKNNDPLDKARGGIASLHRETKEVYRLHTGMSRPRMGVGSRKQDQLAQSPCPSPVRLYKVTVSPRDGCVKNPSLGPVTHRSCERGRRGGSVHTSFGQRRGKRQRAQAGGRLKGGPYNLE